MSAGKEIVIALEVMSASKKIMVVIGDEVDLRQIVAALFRRKGWTVYELCLIHI